MDKLKWQKSQPVSDSFKNIDKIPWVIEGIWKILEENWTTNWCIVVTQQNQKKIRELIKTI